MEHKILPRGPRHDHTTYRSLWRQSEQVFELICDHCGVSTDRARKRDRLGNAIKRLTFNVLRQLDIPVRWHSSKTGPGFRWDGNVELANKHLGIADYRERFRDVVEFVKSHLIQATV